MCGLLLVWTEYVCLGILDRRGVGLRGMAMESSCDDRWNLWMGMRMGDGCGWVNQYHWVISDDDSK